MKQEKFKKGNIIINLKTKKIEKVYHQDNNRLALYQIKEEYETTDDNIPMVKGGSGDEFKADRYELLSKYKKRKKQPSIWDIIGE